MEPVTQTQQEEEAPKAEEAGTFFEAEDGSKHEAAEPDNSSSSATRIQDPVVGPSLASKIRSAAMNASEWSNTPTQQSYYTDSIAYNPQRAENIQSHVERFQAFHNDLTEKDETAKWLFSQLTRRRNLLSSIRTIGRKPVEHLEDTVLRAVQDGDWHSLRQIEDEFKDVSGLIEGYGWDWSETNVVLGVIERHRNGLRPAEGDSIIHQDLGNNTNSHQPTFMVATTQRTQKNPDTSSSPGPFRNQQREVRESATERAWAGKSTEARDFYNDPLGKQLQGWGQSGIRPGMDRYDRTAALRLGHDPDSLAADLALCETVDTLKETEGQRDLMKNLGKVIENSTSDFKDGPRESLQSAMDMDSFADARRVLLELDSLRDSHRFPKSRQVQNLSKLLDDIAHSMAVMENVSERAHGKSQD
ncbi:hypothetical protein IAR50_004971 [Cryptococcus sp. DSM 104548]